jgi:hypothetical protein
MGPWAAAQEPCRLHRLNRAQRRAEQHQLSLGRRWLSRTRCAPVRSLAVPIDT